MAPRTKKAADEAAGQKAAADEAPAVEIHTLGTEMLLVPLRGTAPLIVHRFSEKAKRQMLDNMQGRKSPKSPKDPHEDYLGAFYRYKGDDGRSDLGPFGFPVIGFKASTVSGARFYDQVTMTGLKQCLFFRGEVGADGQMLARIDGEPHMREDVVRVNRGGSDLRYRPCWNEWTTELHIVYVQSMLTRNSVLSLIDAGGLGVGVGEWRPEKGGDFGTYEIDQSRDVQVLPLNWQAAPVAHGAGAKRTAHRAGAKRTARRTTTTRATSTRATSTRATRAR